jgi:putative nucleotidyltransferase with HDIG domain
MGMMLESVALALIFVVAINFSYKALISDLVITIVCTYAPVLIALLLQPVFESSFNILSNQKLNELTDHNSPLIKRLINEAPGTFNHCLAVASYAELCAISIGENPHLAKACAYYHDIGKIENPKYFGENQSDVNYHDGLLPEVSAEIIRRHTTDGYELCDKYRIPAEIRNVTVQHHGTLPMAVFYYKAKKLTDSHVDTYDYEYHGTTPISKIAAIMMICDAAEAAIRASGKPTAEEVDKLITNIINDRIEKHQFDNCDITLKDLNTIKTTIINVYGGHVHSRVKYPSGK